MATTVYRERIITERVWTDCPHWALPTAAQVLARGQHQPGRQASLVEIEGTPGIVAAALLAIQSHARYFVPAGKGGR